VTPRVVATTCGPVEVAEQGSGSAVLVVHGTPGDWTQARALADDLGADHRVLLPSRPGYGRTPLSTGRTPRQQADALAALLDALGVDSAAVVGISGGGPSSRALAAHHRDRVTHLVLLCAVAEHLLTVPAATRLLAGVPGLWEVGGRLASRRAHRALRDREAALVEATAQLGPRERDAVADPVVAEELLGFAASRARALAHVAGLRNDLRAFRDATVPDPWPTGPDVPALVVHGDADDVVPLAHGQHHAATVPGAVLEVLEGVGHVFPLTLRREVAARTRAFLEAA
jgi:pimeloyl-ACP methyl ester carboxylesterase